MRIKGRSSYSVEKLLIEEFQQNFQPGFLKTTFAKIHISSSKTLSCMINYKIFSDIEFFY